MSLVDEDCWDAFGSDDEEEEDDDGDHRVETVDPTQSLHQAVAAKVALFLTQHFLKSNSTVPLNKRRVLYFGNAVEAGTHWQACFHQKGITALVVRENLEAKESEQGVSDPITTSSYDAIISVKLHQGEDRDVCKDEVIELSDQFDKYLLRGGALVVVSHPGCRIELDPDCWDAYESPNSTSPTTPVYENSNVRVISVMRSLRRVQHQSCRWLSSKHSVVDERKRACQATIPTSTFEIMENRLTETSKQRAVDYLEQYGYCILPRLLNPQECEMWGQTVLHDLRSAAKILLDRDSVDIFNPQSSQRDPQSYRELSMREDLRMDLRDGPKIREIRRHSEDPNHVAEMKDESQQGLGFDNACNKPFVIKRTHGSRRGFLRFQPDMLEVVRRAMNPKRGSLYKGNFGRYNFDGSGPDGSFQNLRVSPVGGIVSLPGSADQALHADTPHLFEHETLPAHYINAFTPGCRPSKGVGGTAFVHGSHKLEFTATHLGQNDDDHSTVLKNLVRPQLELGDVLLFDCRTLHFGLANESASIERPLLYCNMTHAWFHDPKNWDDLQPIFDL